MDNTIDLPIQLSLPIERHIEIVGPVRPPLGTEEHHVQDVLQDLFRWLSVPLVHGEEEEREHEDDHDKDSRVDAQWRLEQEENGNADERPASETNELSFCQIKEDFGFYLG